MRLGRGASLGRLLDDLIALKSAWHTVSRTWPAATTGAALTRAFCSTSMTCLKVSVSLTVTTGDDIMSATIFRR